MQYIATLSDADQFIKICREEVPISKKPMTFIFDSQFELLGITNEVKEQLTIKNTDRNI